MVIQLVSYTHNPKSVLREKIRNIRHALPFINGVFKATERHITPHAIMVTRKPTFILRITINDSKLTG